MNRSNKEGRYSLRLTDRIVLARARRDIAKGRPLQPSLRKFALYFLAPYSSVLGRLIGDTKEPRELRVALIRILSTVSNVLSFWLLVRLLSCKDIEEEALLALERIPCPGALETIETYRQGLRFRGSDPIYFLYKGGVDASKVFRFRYSRLGPSVPGDSPFGVLLEQGKRRRQIQTSPVVVGDFLGGNIFGDAVTMENCVVNGSPMQVSVGPHELPLEGPLFASKSGVYRPLRLRAMVEMFYRSCADSIDFQVSQNPGELTPEEAADLGTTVGPSEFESEQKNRLTKLAGETSVVDIYLPLAFEEEGQIIYGSVRCIRHIEGSRYEAEVFLSHYEPANQLPVLRRRRFWQAPNGRLCEREVEVCRILEVLSAEEM